MKRTLVYNVPDASGNTPCNLILETTKEQCPRCGASTAAYVPTSTDPLVIGTYVNCELVCEQCKVQLERTRIKVHASTDREVGIAMEKQLCEKCHTNAGQPFSFYYGRKIGSREEGNLKITTYKVSGNQKVTLCKKCITKYRISRGVTYFILMLILGFLAWGGFSIGSGIKDLFTIGALFSCFGVFVLFAMLKGVLFNDKKTQGEDVAISVGRKRKELQRYQYFWNSATASEM